MQASIDAVHALFAEHGSGDYVGEAVSQLQHALQCAAHARAAGAAPETIAGAMLHDVGHMLGLRDPAAHARMDDCGTMHHESVGADWLAALGFPRGTTEVVRRHVDAKRYLCWKNPAYAAKLSPASRTTLGFQGGPMADEEAARFEADPLGKTILLMRTWDEAAKDPSAAVPALEHYTPMLLSLLGEEAERRKASA
jgi:phosphonate degradation associated HDIG domain protein